MVAEMFMADEELPAYSGQFWKGKNPAMGQRYVEFDTSGPQSSNLGEISQGCDQHFVILIKSLPPTRA
jgi:hypothetical protein